MLQCINLASHSLGLSIDFYFLQAYVSRNSRNFFKNKPKGNNLQRVYSMFAKLKTLRHQSGQTSIGYLLIASTLVGILVVVALVAGAIFEKPEVQDDFPPLNTGAIP